MQQWFTCKKGEPNISPSSPGPNGISPQGEVTVKYPDVLNRVKTAFEIRLDQVKLYPEN